mmetsp:Transcript_3286/g.7122  ORF Transcript_3286/g.7122 Transcript_3286/m.7122 type:complete len:90 (-) Transcript_3286:58-327(-)
MYNTVFLPDVQGGRNSRTFLLVERLYIMFRYRFYVIHFLFFLHFGVHRPRLDKKRIAEGNGMMIIEEECRAEKLILYMNRMRSYLMGRQ